MIFLILIVALLELVATSALKVWANSPKKWWAYASGVLLYGILAILYGQSLKEGNLSTVNALWQVMAIVLVTIISVLVFHESPNAWEWAGVAMACVSMGLLVAGTLVDGRLA